MAENFEQQLRSANKIVMDIVQQGLTTGVIRLDGQAVKKAIADIVADILVAGAGVTITYDETDQTITLTSP